MALFASRISASVRSLSLSLAWMVLPLKHSDRPAPHLPLDLTERKALEPQAFTVRQVKHAVECRPLISMKIQYRYNHVDVTELYIQD